MNWKRKSKCPECKRKLIQFGMNVNDGTIECQNCNAQFNPKHVLRDSDIIFLSESLPSDKQEAFLTSLGFEKKSVHRTSRSLLYGFMFSLIGGGVTFTLILLIFGVGIKSISPFIGSLFLSSLIYDYYKEEKPQWRRKGN